MYVYYIQCMYVVYVVCELSWYAIWYIIRFEDGMHMQIVIGGVYGVSADLTVRQ